MLTDTPNSIAARIGEFIRSEAQQQASVPEPLTAEQLHPENALMPIAMPSIDDFAADYRSCLQKFSERERAALDHVIQALSSVPR